MRKPHQNLTNPCARALSEIMQTCFLINEETDYDAQLTWSGHVNEISVYVTPKGASMDHAVLEFDEYVNTSGRASGFYHLALGVDTYPKVKIFLATLKRFHRDQLTD